MEIKIVFFVMEIKLVNYNYLRELILNALSFFEVKIEYRNSSTFGVSTFGQLVSFAHYKLAPLKPRSHATFGL
jgi:hypothetical protein